MSAALLQKAAAPFASHEARLAAVRRRDPAADGAFFYSVASTGVYCRPSCASRPARPENLAFHDSVADAERAGFRPCKRCRPNEPPRTERQAAAVARACRLIEAAETMPSLGELAAEVGISRFHFHRLFKEVTGLTPKGYAAAQQMRRAKAELDAGESVTSAIYGAGYGSPSRFYERAADRLGMKPSTFQKGGVGTRIRWTVEPCSLGLVLIAATERGICAIQFGETEGALASELARRFPAATLERADAGFSDWVQATVAYIDAPRPGFDLPLDIAGTAFQERVWQALRQIPLGRTASYGEIAGRIGSPRAVRAVARACGANPAAVAIPCHRVVAADGKLSGYRWGTERKRKLLEREGAL
jgi:AraC family transcriptional regulator of adaptative response/methylated-DNA-[protein]-cysteine methyltransferase